MITVTDQTLRQYQFRGKVREGKVPMTAPAPPPAPEPPPPPPALAAPPELTRVLEMLTELASRPAPPPPSIPAPAPANVSVTVPPRPTSWTLEVTGRDDRGDIKTVRITGDGK